MNKVLTSMLGVLMLCIAGVASAQSKYSIEIPETLQKFKAVQVRNFGPGSSYRTGVANPLVEVWRTGAAERYEVASIDLWTLTDTNVPGDAVYNGLGFAYILQKDARVESALTIGVSARMRELFEFEDARLGVGIVLRFK